jgi:hypothetical protein
MSSFISNEAKDIFRARMMDLFDTWKRPHEFTLYKTPTETIISIDPDYSSNWASTAYGNNQITYTEIKESFEVRIWFPTFPQKYLNYQPDDVDLRVKMAQDVGTIKIQCLKDCYDFLLQSEKVVLFNTIYRLDTDIRRVGIFDMELFTFTMMKQN